MTNKKIKEQPQNTNNMNNAHLFPHKECKYFIDNYFVGFRLVSPSKRDCYNGTKPAYHSLVFMLEGEVECSYNEFLNRRFKKGDLFLIPQASSMYAVAVEDTHMLVLTFNNSVENLCDYCTLSNYVKSLQSTDYDFIAIEMTPVVWLFAQTIEKYIQRDIKCAYLHQIKQRELFIVLQFCYTQEQIAKVFYPALGYKPFRSRVLENYDLNISMTYMAEHCNMAPKSFSRRFKQEFGLSFRNWMLKQKAKRVELRLSMPDTSLGDIIRDFNFSDFPHLCRFCKEQYGTTPTELVKKIREKSTEEKQFAP